MSQPWFAGSGTASTHQTRRRPSYVPPHHRAQPNITASHSVPRGSHRRLPPVIDDISQKFGDLDVVSQEDNGEKRELPAVVVPVEAEGVDIPPPAISFEEMGFSSKALNDNIQRCKYVNPTPIQQHAIPVAMRGRDLMACAQTGSGKTAAFCFPIINSITEGKQQQQLMARYGNGDVACPFALILAPTRELASQIHEEARKFSNQTGVKVEVVYGGSSVYQQLRNLGKGVDILVATPGRLVDLIERSKVSLVSVKYLALDEADRMLDMGFEPQVRKIVQQLEMPPPGARQTLLFSATFPPEIKKLASDFLLNYIFIAAGKVGSSTDLIAQRVEYVPDMDKRRCLMNLLYSQKMNKNTAKDLTLIFVETKRGADALERWLCSKGYPSAAIHGDKVQMERERALKSFRNGRTPILVATDVAARGLDIPHVAHVINFDLPRAVDDYVHRIGRTGRAGKSGLATALFNEKNTPIAKALVELMNEANQEVPEWLLDYANTPCNNFSRGGRRGGGRKYGSDYSNQYNGAAEYPCAAYYESDPYGNGAMSDANIGDSSEPLPGNYGFDYACVTATGWE